MSPTWNEPGIDAECTNFPDEVAEMALAHVIRDKLEFAYQRGDPVEMRQNSGRWQLRWVRAVIPLKHAKSLFEIVRWIPHRVRKMPLRPFLGLPTLIPKDAKSATVSSLHFGHGYVLQ